METVQKQTAQENQTVMVRVLAMSVSTRHYVAIALKDGMVQLVMMSASWERPTIITPCVIVTLHAGMVLAVTFNVQTEAFVMGLMSVTVIHLLDSEVITKQLYVLVYVYRTQKI